MIASRIWYLNNQSVRCGSHMSSLHPIARAVVESGAIYSSMLIALLILYGQKSWFQYIIIDAVSHPFSFLFSGMLKVDRLVILNHCKIKKIVKCLNLPDQVLNTGNCVFNYYRPHRTWDCH